MCEQVSVVHRMRNAISSIVNMMDVPPHASAIRAASTGSNKGHYRWSIAASVGIMYAKPPEALGNILRKLMRLRPVPARASRPEQRTELWPLKKAL
jgi:hypothetical protein